MKSGSLSAKLNKLALMHSRKKMHYILELFSVTPESFLVKNSGESMLMSSDRGSSSNLPGNTLVFALLLCMQQSYLYIRIFE